MNREGFRSRALSHSVRAGVPRAALGPLTTLYWDVRSLPNVGATTVANYASLGGDNSRIAAAVFASKGARALWAKVEATLVRRSATERVVAIFGCKSGQHRSQAFALRAAALLRCDALHLDWPMPRCNDVRWAAGRAAGGEYACEACGARDLDASSLTAHIAGKKHAKRAAKAMKRAARASAAAVRPLPLAAAPAPSLPLAVRGLRTLLEAAAAFLAPRELNTLLRCTSRCCAQRWAAPASPGLANAAWKALYFARWAVAPPLRAGASVPRWRQLLALRHAGERSTRATTRPAKRTAAHIGIGRRGDGPYKKRPRREQIPGAPRPARSAYMLFCSDARRRHDKRRAAIRAESGAQGSAQRASAQAAFGESPSAGGAEGRSEGDAEREQAGAASGSRSAGTRGGGGLSFAAIGAEWRALSTADGARWRERAAEDKARFDTERGAWAAGQSYRVAFADRPWGRMLSY